MFGQRWFPIAPTHRGLVQLRGLADEQSLLAQTIKWDLNVDPEFHAKWHRDVQVLDQGAFGRRLRIFFHQFYGEGFEIKPGQTLARPSDGRPFACIVWSGRGTVNGSVAFASFLVLRGPLLVFLIARVARAGTR